MSQRGVLVLDEAASKIAGDCFGGKIKYPPRNDIIKLLKTPEQSGVFSL